MIVALVHLPRDPQDNLVHEIACGRVRDIWTPQLETSFHVMVPWLGEIRLRAHRLTYGVGLE
jgi:hypothetical protein